MWFIGLLVIGVSAFVFIFLAGMALLTLNTRPCTEQEAESRRLFVMNVGGCNKYGYCGVTLSDGSVSSASLPSIGEKVFRSDSGVYSQCRVEVESK